jgi:Alanyl-tRNA synthetase
VPEKLEKTLLENKNLQNEYNKILEKYISIYSKQMKPREINGYKFYFEVLKDVDMEFLRKLADYLQRDDVIILLFSKSENKLIAHFRIGKLLREKFNAKNLMIEILGKGGGSDIKAEGGTENLEILGTLEDKIKKLLI